MTENSDEAYYKYFLEEEIDEAIRNVLIQRKELNSSICDLDEKIIFWEKKLIKKREEKELIVELKHKQEEQKKKLLSITYQVTPLGNNKKFDTFCELMDYLKDQKTIVHDNFDVPRLSDLFVDFTTISTNCGYLQFLTKAICMKIENVIYIFTPRGIILVSDLDYKYIATYKLEAYHLDRIVGEWREREEYYTWTYQRQDGKPDMRYKNNPVKVNYTYQTHTTNNIIRISIGEKKVEYEVEGRVRNYIMTHKNQFQMK